MFIPVLRAMSFKVPDIEEVDRIPASQTDQPAFQALNPCLVSDICGAPSHAYWFTFCHWLFGPTGHHLP